jgi:hypothetical protein
LVDENFETIAVEVKRMDPKHTWEIVGIYRAPCEDMRVTEILAARIAYLRNSTKRSIIVGDLNLPQADWNGKTEGASGGMSVFVHDQAKVVKSYPISSTRKEGTSQALEGYIRFRPRLLFVSASPSTVPIPVAALCKVWVYSRSLAGIVGSNPAGGMDICLL